MAEENLGLKDKEESTSGDQPDATKTNPEVVGDLKNEDKAQEKSAEQKAEKLLADGTPADKSFTHITKKFYDETTNKAKLYEVHAPLLDKVLKDPELVERLLETKEKDNLDLRVQKLEEERKANKRKEIKDAVIEAVSQWPDFEERWSEVQPIAEALAKNGVPYKDALRRGYFAINPDAAATEKERLAKEGVNNLGTFSSSTNYSPKSASFKNNLKLTDSERRVAKALMMKEEDYGALLEKHQDWLRSNGFSSVE